MPYPVTNNCGQIITVNPGTAQDTIPNNSTRSITNPIYKIQFNGITYTRFGDWVITPGTSLTATHDQPLNRIYLTTPQGFNVIYTPPQVTQSVEGKNDLEEINTKGSDLSRILRETQKNVSIQIAPADLSTLKASNYKLCFAKKVGNAGYNVVWQSYTRYLANNDFSWNPTYQLFGSNSFQEQVKVKVSTNIVTIGLGETSILDSYGNLQNPSTGGKPTALNLKNQYGSIHPGVMQLSTGIDGIINSTPIYVAQEPIVIGDTSLTPIEKVLVWFQQDVETSTMFSESRSLSVEIDLTTTNSETRLFQDQGWSIPG